MPFTEQEAEEISEKGPAGQVQVEAKVLKAVGFAASGSLDGSLEMNLHLVITAAACSIGVMILVAVPG